MDKEFTTSVQYIGGLYPQWDYKISTKTSQLDYFKDMKVHLNRKEKYYSNKNISIGEVSIDIKKLIDESDLNEIINRKRIFSFNDKWIDI